MIAGFGGGFLAAPFSTTQSIGIFTVIPNAIAGVYGNWSHLGAPILTGSARQIGISIWPIAYGSIYSVQIAMGSVGAEVLWQPSDGSGFYVDWGSLLLWNVPREISFPILISGNKEFSCRCASTPGAGSNLKVNLYLWD